MVNDNYLSIYVCILIPVSITIPIATKIIYIYIEQ